MLRIQMHGLGGLGSITPAETYCRPVTTTMDAMASCMGLYNAMGAEHARNAYPGGGGSSGGGGIFSQPQQSGGFVMPSTFNPFGTSPIMPGMPGYGLQPGMPGYIPPTAWYAGPMGIALLAGAALVAYKLLSK